MCVCVCYLSFMVTDVLSRSSELIEWLTTIFLQAHKTSKAENGHTSAVCYDDDVDRVYSVKNR